MNPVLLDGRTLTPQAVAAIAGGAPVVLDRSARARIETCARWWAQRGQPNILRDKWEWLVGATAPADDARVVRTFVAGHCAGVGEPLPRPIVRALMAARANVLATGVTGCRPEVVELLVAMLNADVVPVVPSHGDVGAAGSAPLAHVTRVLARFGGRAWRGGVLLPADQAMEGLPAVELNQKEALSLLNGSTLTTAMGALAIARAERLLKTAVASCALSFEVVRADLACLDPLAMEARHHPGPIAVASQLRSLLEGSELCHVGRRPDAFSVRCAPAVLGAAFDALEHAAETVTAELNAAADNPLVFPVASVTEAGTFHGAPVALALDQLRIALVQVASIAERRVFRLTYGQLSGLPSFLVPGTGLNSGLMLAQYTAASLVSECKVLSHPGSVDSLPLVEHREDHVSMGPVAARHTLRVLEALADVLGIELLCGAQGLDFHLAGQAVDAAGALVAVAPRRPGTGALEVYEAVRRRVPRTEDDRVLHPDLRTLGAAVRAGAFTDAPGPW